MSKLQELWDNGHWPETTDIACWYCCHSFPHKPVPGVYKYNDRTHKFTIYGVFCSWNCAKADAVRGSGADKDWMLRSSWLTFLRKQTEGHIRSIVPAPDRRLLQMFGGPMSIEEFRDTSSHAVVQLKFPPQTNLLQCEVSHRDIRKQMAKELNPSVTTRLDAAIQNSNAKSEPLRLKRSKPIARTGTQSSLLKSMNLMETS
jgi:hypothetical protein